MSSEKLCTRSRRFIDKQCKYLVRKSQIAPATFERARSLASFDNIGIAGGYGDKGTCENLVISRLWLIQLQDPPNRACLCASLGQRRPVSRRLCGLGNPLDQLCLRAKPGLCPAVDAETSCGSADIGFLLLVGLATYVSVFVTERRKEVFERLFHRLYERAGRLSAFGASLFQSAAHLCS